MEKYKCVAYCRVSKHSSRKIYDKDGNEIKRVDSKEPSIEEQVKAIKAFVALHSDRFELVAEPFFEVKSGASSRTRTQFKEVQKWITDGIKGCNTLLVYMKDRIARNYQDYLNTLWTIKSQGGYIFSIEASTTDEPLCVTHNDNDDSNDAFSGIQNILIDTFDAYAYQAYLDRLSKASVARNERRILENGGKYIAGFPKYGYNYVKKTDDVPEHYEINENEAKVIRLIFDWYVDFDWGCEKIAKELNKQGYQYRRNFKDKDNLQVFTKDSVRQVLLFEGYATGNCKFFATENILRRKPINNKLHEKFDKKYKRIADIPEDELNEFLEKNVTTPRDYVVANVYPIIISPEIYERYKKMKAGRHQVGKNPNEPNNTGWLNGIVYCECGEKLVCQGARKVYQTKKLPDGTTSKSWYTNAYKCVVNKRNQSKIHWGEKCPHGDRSISYHVDEVVLSYLKMILSNGQFKRFCAEGARNYFDKENTSENIDDRLKNLKKRYNDLANELKALNMSYVQGVYSNPVDSGMLSEKEYQEEKERINQDIKAIASSITDLNYQKQSAKDNEKTISDYEKDIDDWVENDPSGLIHTFINRAQIVKKEDYLIFLYMNFIPKEYNPIILKWSGFKSDINNYKVLVNNRLSEDLDIAVDKSVDYNITTEIRKKEE